VVKVLTAFLVELSIIFLLVRPHGAAPTVESTTVTKPTDTIVNIIMVTVMSPTVIIIMVMVIVTIMVTMTAPLCN